METDTPATESGVGHQASFGAYARLQRKYQRLEGVITGLTIWAIAASVLFLIALACR